MTGDRSGDRHRRKSVSFRPSPAAWAMIDRKAAAAGKQPDQVAREIIREALELELEHEAELELEREAELDRAHGAELDELLDGPLDPAALGRAADITGAIAADFEALRARKLGDGATCPDHHPVLDNEAGWLCTTCGAEAPPYEAAPAPRRMPTPYRYQELTTPANYQRLAVEQDRNGTRFFYMGDNYVAFTPVEWAAFLLDVAIWSTKEIRGGR